LDFFGTPPSDNPKGWPWIGQHKKCRGDDWHVIKPSWARTESRPEAKGSGFVANHNVMSMFCDGYKRISSDFDITGYYYDKKCSYYDARPTWANWESTAPEWSSWK